MDKQKEAFDKLSKLKVGALFMEMGTGKTKVALDLINSRKDKIDYVLWTCPCSTKTEIKAELNKWYPDFDIEFDIVGIETLSQSSRIYSETLKKVQAHKTFMVVDESLKIKTAWAKCTRRCLTLGRESEYRLILNGTPISKNIMDMYTQMEFLSPRILNMSYNEYKYTYCILNTFKKGYKTITYIQDQTNVEHLISKIEPYIYDSSLELDVKRNEYNYTYEIDMDAYNTYKYELAEKFQDEGDFDFLCMMTSLQHYYTKYNHELVEELINEINDQVIVFVRYLDNIPDGADCLTGNTKDKEKVVNDFKNGKIKVLYITYGCGSFGLNFQNCKHMIFADHTFDYAQRVQAEARIYRNGQTEDVTYYNIWCDCGLENMIRNSIDTKSYLLGEIKTEITKKGVEKWVKSL